MMYYLGQFAFIVFCSFSLVTGFYLARNFWFFASEGMDEIIHFLFKKPS